MKKAVVACFVLVVCLSFVSQVISQSPPPRTPSDIRRDKLESRITNMRILDVLARKTAKERREFARTKYYKPVKSKKLLEQLKIEPRLLSEYQSFLQSPNTGIFKLLPLTECKKIKNLKKIEKCFQHNANIKEFGIGFSFRENKQAFLAKSDLSVGKKYLVAGRYSVQTILVNLGDVALNDLTINSSGVSYLKTVKPGDNYKQIDAQFDEYKNGLTIGSYSNGKMSKSYSYGKISKAKLNNTYAIRSIAYRPSDAQMLPKDKDVIVVFKLIEIDKKSGGLTIILKELSRKDGVMMEKKETGNLESEVSK